MRKIDLVVLHCSATPVTMDIGAEKIKEWHTSAPRNWSDIGYHYVIKLDGAIEEGRPLERAGAHARGHNKNSIGICLVGGVDENNKPKNTMTEAQEISLKALLLDIDDMVGEVKVIGHNEVSSKSCPSFDVQEWLESNKNA